MEPSDNKISIIIVSFNSEKSLAFCLSNLSKAVENIEYEIILVDNNSHDKSVALVKSTFEDSIIIKNQKNIGFAKACNSGVNNASGKFLLFLNPDVNPDLDSIVNLREFYGKLENPGALVPRMRNPDNTFQPTCRKFPTISNIFLSRGSILSKLFSKSEVYTLPDYSETTKVAAVAATMLFINKSIFERVGKFDERFFMYMEDTDLSLKLSHLGYNNYFIPKAGGIHLWGESSQSYQCRRIMYHHFSVWKYFLKHFANGFSIILLPLLLMLNLTLQCISRILDSKGTES